MLCGNIFTGYEEAKAELGKFDVRPCAISLTPSHMHSSSRTIRLYNATAVRIAFMVRVPRWRNVVAKPTFGILPIGHFILVQIKILPLRGKRLLVSEDTACVFFAEVPSGQELELPMKIWLKELKTPSLTARRILSLHYVGVRSAKRHRPAKRSITEKSEA
ncbi:hypothetical protein D918_06528 [Trichuris suis]|nr:hypothetical protein D918_06528 [Trichuris suis]